jgi:hypothetical protein
MQYARSSPRSYRTSIRAPVVVPLLSAARAGTWGSERGGTTHIHRCRFGAFRTARYAIASEVKEREHGECQKHARYANSKLPSRCRQEGRCAEQKQTRRGSHDACSSSCVRSSRVQLAESFTISDARVSAASSRRPTPHEDRGPFEPKAPTPGVWHTAEHLHSNSNGNASFSRVPSRDQGVRPLVYPDHGPERQQNREEDGDIERGHGRPRTYRESTTPTCDVEFGLRWRSSKCCGRWPDASSSRSTVDSFSHLAVRTSLASTMMTEAHADCVYTIRSRPRVPLYDVRCALG